MPQFDPDQLAALAAHLIASGRLVEAEWLAREGLAHSSRHARLNYELASAVLKQGRADEAVALLRRAMSRGPERNAQSLLAFAVNYAAAATRREVFEAHVRCGFLLREHVGACGRLPPPRPASDGTLRVGFVSADLFRHSVSYFLEPVLEHLDRSRFTPLVYDLSPKRDEVSRRLRGLAPLWREVRGVDALSVEEDELAILVDLSGLSAGNALKAFARRLAPVQVSYLGYPNTTGLDSMDARLVDAITDPPGEADRFATEALHRLPGCFLCYRPPNDAPPPRGPVAGPHPITFGCFGNLAKLNAPLLRAWAGLLESVPGSRLVLKNHALADARLHEPLLARLADAGIRGDRVELMAPSMSEAEHLAQYRAIDIALDTFPYAGTTTTCEALLMGVPVISAAGDQHASRVGLSLLSAAGVPELCHVPSGRADESGRGSVGVSAMDALEGYVALARGLANDRGTLSGYHAGLRGRLLASALCDSQSFGARFSGVLAGLV